MLVPHLDEAGQVLSRAAQVGARHFQDYLRLAYLYGDAADVDATIVRVRERRN